MYSPPDLKNKQLKAQSKSLSHRVQITLLRTARPKSNPQPISDLASGDEAVVIKRCVNRHCAPVLNCAIIEPGQSAIRKLPIKFPVRHARGGSTTTLSDLPCKHCVMATTSNVLALFFCFVLFHCFRSCIGPTLCPAECRQQHQRPLRVRVFPDPEARRQLAAKDRARQQEAESEHGAINRNQDVYVLRR